MVLNYLIVYKYIIIFFLLITLKNIYNFIKGTNIINNKKTELKKDSLHSERINIDSKLKYYENFLNDIQTYNHTHIYSDNIYWCWLQGIENAPELYKANFNSVKNNCIHHNIIVINQTNLFQYVKFPSFIVEKHKNNIIDNTHFSDLLRLELLIKHGGTWIDASVLITKYDKTFFKNDLFFFRSINYARISGSNWFITSEKNSPVLITTRDLLYEYWRKENYLYDYFIFHLLFKYAYNKYIADYAQMPKISNIQVHFLQKYLLDKFNYTLYYNILKSASVHKLNKKYPTDNTSFISYIIGKYSNIK